MTQRSEFGIVWQLCADRSPTGRTLPSPVAFPICLEGDELIAMKAGEPVQPEALHLLHGILIAFNDPSPYVACASPAQMARALHDFVSVLRAPSLEVVLLDVAAALKRRHGSRLGFLALQTALKVLPQSTLMRSELLMTLWSISPTAEERERQDLLEQSVAEFPKLDLTVLNDYVVETLVYAQLVALSVLQQHDKRDAFARDVAVRYINTPAVAARVKYLLEQQQPDFSTIFDQGA